MGALDGRVAFISGGARGQGRSHAVRMAEEGADIITFDICDQIESVPYPMASAEDLAETVELVEKLDRRIVAKTADVRDEAAVKAALDEGVSELGGVDIVVANAGIAPIFGGDPAGHRGWHDAVDVMLTGVFHTCEAAIPRLIEQGRGGSIIITSSTAGLKGLLPDYRAKSDGFLGYIAAKHGVVGLMKAYANALAAFEIRCNTIHPTGVNTPMVDNEFFMNWVMEHPELANVMQNALPIPLVQPEDISNAMIFLASDAGRYVTGVQLPVDAGFTVR
ncbi:MAG TPA: mycofactocin-coupled SDR family oxidoreductase [Acidimicrobiia bacterium]|nr:mycofactocin-coupled SDR family oxidoreductase [Acidimicrobiia bacterium]